MRTKQLSWALLGIVWIVGLVACDRPATKPSGSPAGSANAMPASGSAAAGSAVSGSANEVATGGSGSATVADPVGAANAFANQVLDAIERDDLDAWTKVLSTRMQMRTADPAVRKQHFTAWKTSYLPKVAALRKASFVFVPADKPSVAVTIAGEKQRSFAIVAIENGVLRLDEL